MQLGSFDAEKRLKRLGMMGDALERVGQIVDAVFVDVPRQRNTPKENKTIRDGGIPEEWKTDENSRKLAQKDTNLRGHKRQCSRQSGPDGPDRRRRQDPLC